MILNGFIHVGFFCAAFADARFMNTLLTVVEGPLKPDLSLDEIQQVVGGTFVELAADAANSGTTATSNTVNLTASVSQMAESAEPIAHDWGPRS